MGQINFLNLNLSHFKRCRRMGFRASISSEKFFLLILLIQNTLTLISAFSSVSADIITGEYGSPCNGFRDCETTTKWCHPYKKTCDCVELERGALVQIYNEKTRSCYSPVGSKCLIQRSKGKSSGYQVRNYTI